ncbi:hypothetical protein [Robiginitalea aurantiaca]|uniref:DUF3566 domain-containing protein n=1 Tax=Robiginitalea aurantiaca TaxID=3056915 RepID=A0ABT7WCG8_9FLAO|nr:hypothetical protein [Robiginitalea aurantiaca]MDM9630618.1 hypothetical protein [Robiginitalea aurantiaca]
MAERRRKMKVLPFARYQALLLIPLGLVAGIVYAFGGLILDALVSLGWMNSDETPGLSYGTVLAFGALIGMPVIFAVFGFLTGILEALCFNLFGRWFWNSDIDLHHEN